MIKIKLHILNLKNFLETVNSCIGEIFLFCSEGKKININGNTEIQNNLWLQYSQSKNYLPLVLGISNPEDYMSIISYYAGDC